MYHSSVTVAPEDALVDRLLAEPVGWNRLINISGLPTDGEGLKRVPLRDVPAEPHNKGDVDILLVGRNRPQDSVAIEAKRLTVPATAIQNLKVYKIDGLKKAVEQANRLAQIGFSQAYLYVFVLIDTREQNEKTKSWSGAPMEVRAMIESELAMRQSDLDPRVGLFVPSFTQPVDETPFDVGSFHGNLRRAATVVRQRLELTEWVAEKAVSHRCRTVL